MSFYAVNNRKSTRQISLVASRSVQNGFTEQASHQEIIQIRIRGPIGISISHFPVGQVFASIGNHLAGQWRGNRAGCSTKCTSCRHNTIYQYMFHTALARFFPVLSTHERLYSSPFTFPYRSFATYSKVSFNLWGLLCVP